MDDCSLDLIVFVADSRLSDCNLDSRSRSEVICAYPFCGWKKMITARVSSREAHF